MAKSANLSPWRRGRERKVQATRRARVQGEPVSDGFRSVMSDSSEVTPLSYHHVTSLFGEKEKEQYRHLGKDIIKRCQGCQRGWKPEQAVRADPWRSVKSFRNTGKMSRLHPPKG